MIPDDVVEQVREHADIVAIVGELVKLKRVGTSYRGPCPFHQGKDPNFSVSPKGGFHCFVCHEKGDVFTFVQKRMGLDFVEAVKYVGAKSGVEVREVRRDHAAEQDPREPFWEINAAAAEYFREQLTSDAGASARSYLESRGFSPELWERFGLGFAPRTSGLRERLAALGFDDERQLKAGLTVVRDEGGEPRARFRNRLMFTIFDVQGRTIAFGGRVIGEGEPKYLNSPESPTFSKSQTLYGINWAKQAIRRDERVLLVEGYFDCLRLIAAGVESAVAPLGTALTEQQADVIRRYTSTAFLLYDSDQAGLKATFRAGDVLLRRGVKVHVVTLPQGEDPDTYVQRNGREKLETQLGAAVDVFERKLQILQRGGWFADLRKKRNALDKLLPTIRAAADPLTFDIYLSRAAEIAGVSADALKLELRGQRVVAREAEKQSSAPGPSKASFAKQRDGASEENWLVQLLLKHPHLVERVAEQVELPWFRDARLRAIYRELLASEDLVSLAARLPEHAQHLFEELQASAPMPNPQLVLEKCVARLKIRHIQDQMDVLQRELSVASETEEREILAKKTQLAREAQALGGRRFAMFKFHSP